MTAGLFLLTLVVPHLSAAPVAAADAPEVRVDPAQRYQTIDGFGANINPANWGDGNSRPALDQIVDTLGGTVNRVILEKSDWETTNDDADPSHFNWAAYTPMYQTAKMQNFFDTIDYLTAKGTTVMVSCMGIGPTWNGGGTTLPSAATEDEFVEEVASMVSYARTVRGQHWNLLSPINETDLGNPEGIKTDSVQYTRVLHKLAVKLDGLGFTDMKLVGPDTAYSVGGVTGYMTAMMSDPLVMAHVSTFGLHNYASDAGGAAEAIADSAYPDRHFWMTEFSGSCPGCDTGSPNPGDWDSAVAGPSRLMAFLEQGANGGQFYDAYDSWYEHHNSISYWGLLAWDQVNDTYTPRKSFYAMQQVMRSIRPGSVRIGVTTTNPNLQVIATVNDATGQVTVTGRWAVWADGSTTIDLSAFPGLTRLTSTRTNENVDAEKTADLTSATGVFTVPMIRNEVFTLTGSIAPDTTPPTAPTSVSTTAVTASKVSLSWPAGTDDVGVAGYIVKRDGVPLAQPTTTSYDDTAVAPSTTYHYTVATRDTAGNVSPDSPSLSVTTPAAPPPDTTAPTAPANLVATATSSTQVGLTWGPASDDVGVTGYRVYRGGTLLGSTPDTSYTDTSVVASTTYRYTVRAYDAALNVSTDSNPATVTTPAGPGAAGLVAAYGFDEGSGTTARDATAGAHDGAVANGTWTATGRYGGALNFNGSSTVVTVPDSAALDFTTGLTISAWVKPTTNTGWTTIALKENGSALTYGLYASDNTARPPALYGRFAGTDRAAVGGSALTLGSWSYVSGTFDGTTLRLFVNGVQTGSLAQSGALTASTGALKIGGNSIWGEYFGGTLDELRLYNRALSAAEITTDMNAPVTTAPDTIPPSQPVITSATAVSPTRVDLRWTAATDNVGVTAYQVLRDGVQIASVGTTSYSDTTAVAGAVYTYIIRAVDAAGNATVSQGALVTMPAPDTAAPSVPTDLTATAISPTQVDVAWKASTDNVGVTKYVVTRDGSIIAEPTGTSYRDSGLTGGQTYRYTVRAVDAAGNQSDAASAIVTTPMPPDTEAPAVTLTAPTPGATVSGTSVAVTASAVDNVGVVGVQFLLDGAPLGAEDTTAPYGLTWNSTTASNGTHALAARGRDAAGNVTTSATVLVTVSNASALTVDQTVSTNQSSAAKSIASPSFTTAAAGELLVAFIASDGPRTSAQSFKSVTGGGLTWTLRKRSNAQPGTAEIWTAVAPSVLTNVRVAATRRSGSYVGSITVVTFRGASPSVGAVAGASAVSGAPSVSLTATRAGSLVYAVGNDWDRAVARTLPTGQSIVNSFLAGVGDTFWVQRQDAPATAAGQVIVTNDTAPTNDRWNFTAIEILPA